MFSSLQLSNISLQQYQYSQNKNNISPAHKSAIGQSALEHTRLLLRQAKKRGFQGSVEMDSISLLQP